MSLTIVHHHGAIALKGSYIDELGEKWSETLQIHHRYVEPRLLRNASNNYHMTIVPKFEMENLLDEHLNLLTSFVDTCNRSPESLTDIFDIGGSYVTKGSNEVYFIVVYCPWANSLRSSIGLEPKDFHITLGFQPSDLHDIRKNIQKIKNFGSMNTLLNCCESICTKSHNDLTNSRFSCNQYPLCDSLYVYQEQEIIRSLGNILIENDHIFIVSFWKLMCQYALEFHLYDLVETFVYYIHRKGYPFALRVYLIRQYKQHHRFDANEILHNKLIPMPMATSLQDLKIDKTILFDINLNLCFKIDIKKNCQVVSYNRQNHTVEFSFLPRNFNWVVYYFQSNIIKDIENGAKLSTFNQTLITPSVNPTINPFQFMIAGSAYPTDIEHFYALTAIGISAIFTIHERGFNAQLMSYADSCGIKSFHYEVNDRTPPSTEQLIAICEKMHTFVTRGERVLVHCQGGVGRTNTVLMGYLMWVDKLSYDTASAIVKDCRKVLMSNCQVGMLKGWWNTVSNYWMKCEGNASSNALDALTPNLKPESIETNANVLRDSSQSKSSSDYKLIASTLHLPPLLVLCGFAASGKSTFSKRLVSAYPDLFYRINRDEMRRKGECDDELMKALKKIRISDNSSNTKHTKSMRSFHGMIIIDCCNLTKEKRQEWLEACYHPRAWCLYFDLPIEMCKSRITTRMNHPTIPPGNSGIKILDSMKKQLVPVDENEGFERVIHITSVEDLDTLLMTWSIPYDDKSTDENVVEQKEAGNGSAIEEEYHGSYDLLKFPRTSHALNLGGATRDDKVFCETDLLPFLNNPFVVIEEKLDGANMGIFFDEQNEIRIQNRSHFISSNYHPQFAPLDKWIYQHMEDLWQILNDKSYILYGEWLYATHSIHYSTLPSWFIAYDIYDRKLQKFLSRTELENIICPTNICLAPIIYRGIIHSVEHLKSFVNGPSQYNSHHREGVVIRRYNNQDDYLLERCKLVRSDFIAGNERWNRSSKLQTNSLAY
jgi:predicted kinase